MRGRVPAVLLLAGVLALSACAPKPSLESRWPRADTERTVSEPSHDVAWPLTGKPALDETAAATPVVVLAVGAAPAAALPGLDSADVVFEIAVGATPRRLALFQSSLPAGAGPLRGATPPDDAVAAAYRGTLAQGAGVFADVASLAAAPASSAAAPPAMLFSASSEPSPQSAAAAGVRFTLVPGTEAEWRYDKASGRYQRFVGGKASSAAAGMPLRATNVVVMWAINPTGWPGGALAGVGRASVFFGGRKVSGSWEATGGAPAFKDASGAAVALLPGNTWIEVIDNAANIVVR